MILYLNTTVLTLVLLRARDRATFAISTHHQVHDTDQIPPNGVPSAHRCCAAPGR